MEQHEQPAIQRHFNAARTVLVSQLGIDRSTWQLLGGTSEGRCIELAALALLIGPVVFSIAMGSTLGTMGMPLWKVIPTALFLAAILRIADKALFIAWLEGRELSTSMEILRRVIVPVLIIGAAVVGLPGLLGNDIERVVEEKKVAIFKQLRNDSQQYQALNASSKEITEAESRLNAINTEMTQLSKAIEENRAKARDEEEGNLTYEGKVAHRYQGERYRHFDGQAKKDANYLEILKTEREGLRERVKSKESVQNELNELEKQFRRDVEKQTAGPSIRLKLLWQSMSGDFSLSVTVVIIMLTTLGAEGITYLALTHPSPTHFGRLVQQRDTNLGHRLMLLAQQELRSNMLAQPVVKVRFRSRPQAVPQAAPGASTTEEKSAPKQTACRLVDGGE